MKTKICLCATSLLLLAAVSFSSCKDDNPRVKPAGPQSRFAQTEAKLMAILHQNPNRTDVLVALGNLYFDEKRPDKAIPIYTAYLKKNPKDPNVRTDLGTCYKRLNQYENAAAEFIRVMEEAPKHVNATFNLAVIRDAQGKHLEAADLWEKAASLAKDPQTKTVALNYAKEAKAKSKKKLPSK